MSKLGKRLILAAREGVAIARGELDPSTYGVHHDDDANGLDQGGASFHRRDDRRVPGDLGAH